MQTPTMMLSYRRAYSARKKALVSACNVDRLFTQTCMVGVYCMGTLTRQSRLHYTVCWMLK